MGEDRLPCCRRRGVDAVQALAVEAQATLVRFVREIDARRMAVKHSAASAAVWLRNRYLVSIRSAHQLVRLAKRIDAAPSVVGDGVASGAVNLDQADVVTRAVARIPSSVGVDIRERGAAELVRWCGELDPELLKRVGDRILSIAAPEVADELDRKAAEQAEARRAAGAVLHHGLRWGRLSAFWPAHPGGCGDRAGGDRSAVRAHFPGPSLARATPSRRARGRVSPGVGYDEAATQRG
jgi:hypothetical protein